MIRVTQVVNVEMRLKVRVTQPCWILAYVMRGNLGTPGAGHVGVSACLRLTPASENVQCRLSVIL